MDNNVISFEQMQKFWAGVETWFSNPIDTKAIELNILENLRPKMKWIKEENDLYGRPIYYCSNCSNGEYCKTKFCPECGAKWIGED